MWLHLIKWNKQRNIDLIESSRMASMNECWFFAVCVCIFMTFEHLMELSFWIAWKWQGQKWESESKVWFRNKANMAYVNWVLLLKVLIFLKYLLDWLVIWRCILEWDIWTWSRLVRFVYYTNILFWPVQITTMVK